MRMCMPPLPPPAASHPRSATAASLADPKKKGLFAKGKKYNKWDFGQPFGSVAFGAPARLLFLSAALPSHPELPPPHPPRPHPS